MPLNEKGKKILASMKKQYGSKKGKSVFYAMENSGKLTKVLKAKGGMDASKADFGGRAPGPGDTGGAGGFGQATQQFGNKGSSPTSTGGGGNKTVSSNNTLQNNIVQTGSTTQKFATLPITPLGITIAGLTAVENQRRAKRAKGEYFTSQKKIDPITREFYRTEGRPLQTKIGSPDEDYLKAAGVSGFGIPPNPKEGNQSPTLCPDGTYPPCKTPTTQIKKPNTFLSGFQSYEDGGEVVISSNVDKDLL